MRLLGCLARLNKQLAYSPAGKHLRLYQVFDALVFAENRTDEDDLGVERFALLSALPTAIDRGC